MSEERAEYTAGEQQERDSDPLRLALVAIQRYDRSMMESLDSEITLREVYQLAQLRTLWALAGEVRALRFVMEGEADETGDA